MNYKHIIWDWNGTLVDDAWLCVNIMNKILSAYKLPLISLDDYRKHFVFPVKKYYQHLGFNFNQHPFEKCGLDFIDAFKKRKFEANLFKNTKNILRALHQRGVYSHVLSANHQEVLIKTIEHFKINHFFKNVCGLNHYYATSKIEVGEKLLDLIPVKKHCILVVGDTVHDYEVAQSLGLDCILVSHGHNNRGRLQKTSAKVVASLLELGDFLDIHIN